MNEALIHTLRLRHAEICRYWEFLLRIEPVHTPLAHPDILVFLFDTTLRQVSDELRIAVIRRPLAVPRSCLCGRHPLLAYFLTGEQALLTTLMLAYAESHNVDLPARDRDIIELKLAFRWIAAREIDAFAGVCCHRQGDPRGGRTKSSPAFVRKTGRPICVESL